MVLQPLQTFMFSTTSHSSKKELHSESHLNKYLPKPTDFLETLTNCKTRKNPILHRLSQNSSPSNHKWEANKGKMPQPKQKHRNLKHLTKIPYLFLVLLPSLCASARVLLIWTLVVSAQYVSSYGLLNVLGELSPNFSQILQV